jgi:hypothetical protein
VLTAYERFRFLWGAVDWESGSESPYTTAQTGTSLGGSAAPGDGVGVRRCVVHFDRTGMAVGEDDAECHFDFLNITGGDPDDTWTSTDYETLEALLDTFWASIKGRYTDKLKLGGYHWYRHGPGVVAPNPAERVTTRAVAGTGSDPACPPQVAMSITFRTAVRRSWGRTYLPAFSAAQLTSEGHPANDFVDAIATAASVLYSDANDADFPQVVVSKHLSAVLAIEAIECDNDSDVIRRRRWSTTSHKLVINS